WGVATSPASPSREKRSDSRTHDTLVTFVTRDAWFRTKGRCAHAGGFAAVRDGDGHSARADTRAASLGISAEACADRESPVRSRAREPAAAGACRRRGGGRWRWQRRGLARGGACARLSHDPLLRRAPPLGGRRRLGFAVLRVRARRP